jgi:hypothetical protein
MSNLASVAYVQRSHERIRLRGEAGPHKTLTALLCTTGLLLMTGCVRIARARYLPIDLFAHALTHWFQVVLRVPAQGMGRMPCRLGVEGHHECLGITQPFSAHLTHTKGNSWLTM